MQSLAKSQLVFYAENDNLILKFMWKCNIPRTANTILKKKNNVGKFTLPDFKMWFTATVIKTACYRGNGRLVHKSGE